MKRKLIILEQRSFFDFEKKLPSLGGVQTYVQYLAQLGLKLGFDVTVYLVATENESEKENPLHSFEPCSDPSARCPWRLCR